MNIRLISHRLVLVMLLSLLFLASEASDENGAGYLGVKSQPPRALVYLDGNFVNAFTPTLQLLSLEAGKYRVELARQGYKLYQDEVVIEPGKVLELDAILARVDSVELSRTASKRYIEVYITIISDPSGADVYLDGELIGKTPTRDFGIEAAEEEEQLDRKIKIVKSGYKPYEEILSWAAIRDRVKIYVSPELEPEKKAASPSSPPEPKKPGRFTINPQVIILSIILLVLIAVFAARTIIRRNQRTGSE